MFAAKNELLTRPSGGYRISRSLRFRSSASAYLNRTPASAGNQKTWTWSGWVKRGKSGINNIFGAGWSGSGYFDAIRFIAGDALQFYLSNSAGTGTAATITTSAVYRDYSSWYHIVVACDTSQATNTNSLRIYINGLQATVSGTYPSLNFNTTYINTANVHRIGAEPYLSTPGSAESFDGYLAEVNFIDGYPTVGGTTYNATTWAALNVATLFGAYDTNGVWQPKAYTGTYGTNGFYLPFTNTTSTTTLVADSSGNGNNWTPNNISLTAGVTYDSMIDSPTNYADGGNGRGNYAVLNPLMKWTGTYTLANGNLDLSTTNPNAGYSFSSIGMTSGKWYAEFTATAANTLCGVWGNGNTSMVSSGYPTYYWDIGAYSGGTTITLEKTSGTASGTLGTITAGDIYGVAVDIDNTTIYFYKNGSLVQTVTGMTFIGPLYFVIGIWSSSVSSNNSANFGQRPFSYTPPSGFSALNTQNLPTPTIANGAQYMAATTYAGTSSSNPISNATNNTLGTTFQPDFVWIKNRNYASGTNHVLIDSIRGASLGLASNLTNADFSTTGNFSSINNNGFTVTGTARDYNFLNDTFVGWQWKAGGTGVSNTAGSITSTVSANTSAGFSVVTYTGTGANATVGHGLGVAPSMIIVKKRSSATSSGWGVYHTSIGNTKYLSLSGTDGANPAISMWNNTSPTSFVFTVGTDGWVNASTQTQVAYCFAPVAGYSSFGSFSGNSSSDGSYIYLGFKPKWLLIKGTGSGGSGWMLLDTSRDTYNVSSAVLRPDLSAAESTGYGGVVDILSNGFKLRSTDTNSNSSSTTYGPYIYAAFAEVPFKTARAR